MYCGHDTMIGRIIIADIDITGHMSKEEMRDVFNFIMNKRAATK